MRILVTAITFTVTIGGLFLFENYKTPSKEENYAQIVQGLTKQNQSKTWTPQRSPKATAGTVKPTTKSGKPPIKTPAPPVAQSTASPIGSQTPSFTSVPTITVRLLPSNPTTTIPFPAPMQQPDNLSTAPSPASTPVPSPSSISQQNEQITIISLTSPVKQNSTAQLSLSTPPNAQCSIKVTLPSGSQSTAKGLETKIADTSGNITWSWKINWNTTPGIATIEVTCSKDNQNFSKTLQMEITK